MANRNFPNAGKLYGFHVMPVEIDAQIQFGATGGIVGVTGPGIASITRTGTGAFTIKLQDPYFSFLHLVATMQQAPSPGNTGVSKVETVTASVNNISNPTITIQAYDNTDSAKDAPSGSKMLIRIKLNNSSVQ